MKIRSITRTITGNNYDNISATAQVGFFENPVSAAMLLDAEIKQMFDKIREQEAAQDKSYNQANEYDSSIPF